MDAADNSTLQIRHQTKNEFSVDYESNFLVLPDGKTIVGCDGSDKKKLVVEDITLQNPREIAIHSGFIETLLFDNATQSLLVGDQSGHVKQYEKQKGFLHYSRTTGMWVLEVYCLLRRWVALLFLEGPMALSLRLIFFGKDCVPDF